MLVAFLGNCIVRVYHTTRLPSDRGGVIGTVPSHPGPFLEPSLSAVDTAGLGGGGGIITYINAPEDPPR
jgi:hypothetical protein